MSTFWRRAEARVKHLTDRPTAPRIRAVAAARRGEVLMTSKTGSGTPNRGFLLAAVLGAVIGLATVARLLGRSGRLPQYCRRLFRGDR